MADIRKKPFTKLSLEMEYTCYSHSLQMDSFQVGRLGYPLRQIHPGVLASIGNLFQSWASRVRTRVDSMATAAVRARRVFRRGRLVQ